MESGERPGAPEIVYTGVVRRLARVYGQVNDYWVREVIIRVMTEQAERQEAIAFLEAVALELDSTRRDVGHNLTRPAYALTALTEMGSEGRAGLQRLHAGGGVRERMAHFVLDLMARDGFRTKPH